MGKDFSLSSDRFFSNKSINYYLHLIENSTDIFYMINAKTGKFEYISPSVTKICGFTPEEIIEMGLEGIIQRAHPDDHRMVEKKIMDILAEKIPPHNFNGYIEQRFKHKAGHWVWFGINRNFIISNDGQIEAVVGSLRDITEIKSLQQELEESLNNYKALYDNAQVALYRTRINDGRLLECNETMARFLGYKNRQECIAEHSAEKYYVNLKRRDEFIAILKENGHIDNFEMKTRKLNGDEFWTKTSARMSPNGDYIEGAIWDITATKVLTRTENNILDLIMQGKSNKEIALHLKRSVRTVEDHRSNIMKKLGANNLVELTKKAIDSGFINRKT